MVSQMFKTTGVALLHAESMTRSDHNIWTGITYEDALAARTWLRDLGFDEGILVTDDGGSVQHSEMLWPEGGRVMIHTRDAKVDSTFEVARGAASVYVVEMEDTDYGSRGFSIKDAEGNRWSFGTYAGED